MKLLEANRNKDSPKNLCFLMMLIRERKTLLFLTINTQRFKGSFRNVKAFFSPEN